jgi:hypothetical protein
VVFHVKQRPLMRGRLAAGATSPRRVVKSLQRFGSNPGHITVLVPFRAGKLPVVSHGRARSLMNPRISA